MRNREEVVWRELWEKDMAFRHDGIDNNGIWGGGVGMEEEKSDGKDARRDI